MKDLRDRMSFIECYNAARNIDLIKSIRGTMSKEEERLAYERAKLELKAYLVFFVILGILVLISRIFNI